MSGKTERTGKQQGVYAGRTGGIGLDGHGRGRGSAHCVDMKEEYRYCDEKVR